jgi:hypothetical protein
MGNQFAIGTRDDIHHQNKNKHFKTLISKRIKLKCYKGATEERKKKKSWLYITRPKELLELHLCCMVETIWTSSRVVSSSLSRVSSSITIVSWYPSNPHSKSPRRLLLYRLSLSGESFHATHIHKKKCAIDIEK